MGTIKYLAGSVATVAAAIVLAAGCLPAHAGAAPVNPYLSATGGDVVAGVPIMTDVGGTCPAPVTTAGVVSWNAHTSDFGGAGVAYAAYARGYIQDFVTGQAGGVTNGTDASALAFANTNNSGSLNAAGGLFGGMFGSAPASCVDYWSNQPGGMTTFNGGSVSGLDSGNYSAPTTAPNITISASTIAAGKQVSVYVDGDVIINGNITYAAGPYASRNQIPSFKLIVRGTIYIQPNVTNLDGLYVAVPLDDDSGQSDFDAPKAGTILTCSNGAASYDPDDIKTNNMASICSANRLTFNGSVVAQQIWLLRSYGSLDARSPAEVFNYIPELWLAATAPGAPVDESSGYQSIIGLPPVL